MHAHPLFSACRYLAIVGPVLLLAACSGEIERAGTEPAGVDAVWDVAFAPRDATALTDGATFDLATMADAANLHDVTRDDLVRPDIAGPDIAGPDIAGPDTPTYDVVDPAPACRALTLPTGSFALIPPGLTRNNAAVVYDGRAIWAAWSQPKDDDSSGFAVWAARVACDGSTLVAPFRVHEATRRMDFDPDIAYGDGVVTIAWQAETGGDPNLVAMFRTFRVDGTPIMPEETALIPRQSGQAMQEGAWEVRVAALPGAQFALAAALGVNKAERFQAVVQRFKASGEPVTSDDGSPEDTIYAGFRPQGTQLYPALAATDDGTLHIAWTGSQDFAEEHVRHASLGPGESTATPHPAADALPGVYSGGAALAATPGPGAPVFLAFHTTDDDHNVRLMDANDFDSTGPSLTVGTANAFDHSPAIAAAPGGGLLAWMTLRSGVRNDIRVQRFTYTGAHFTKVGSERLLNPQELFDDHDAYTLSPPAVTHLGGYLFLIVWAEGTNPQFNLRAQILQF